MIKSKRLKTRPFPYHPGYHSSTHISPRLRHLVDMGWYPGWYGKGHVLISLALSHINLSRSLSYMCVHVDIYKYGYYNISLNSCYKYKCNSKGDTDIVNYTLNLITLLLQWNVNDMYESVLLFIDKNVSYDVTYHTHPSDWVMNQKINIMTTENFNNFIRS